MKNTLYPQALTNIGDFCPQFEFKANVDLFFLQIRLSILEVSIRFDGDN
jgi:hypothetical protein